MFSDKLSLSLFPILRGDKFGVIWKILMETRQTYKYINMDDLVV